MLSEAKWTLSTFGIVALDGSEAGVSGTGHVPVSSKTYRQLQRKKPELHKLKMAVGDFYMSLAFLQSYQVDVWYRRVCCLVKSLSLKHLLTIFFWSQELNYQGFYKITKKYDAKTPSERGLQWRTERLDTSLLHTERGSCEEIMCKLEVRIYWCILYKLFFQLKNPFCIFICMISVHWIAQTFMLQLEGGNEEKALKRLELPPRGLEQVRSIGLEQLSNLSSWLYKSSKKNINKLR